MNTALAEYGTHGVGGMEACSQVNVPLAVRFHGVDAYRQDLHGGISQRNMELFERTAAIIAVSQAIEDQLLTLSGARYLVVTETYYPGSRSMSSRPITRSAPFNWSRARTPSPSPTTPYRSAWGPGSRWRPWWR